VVAAVGARIGFLGVAGWFKEGAQGSRHARPIRKAGEHLGQGSRRSVARPGEAGKTGLTRWGQPFSERGDVRAGRARDGERGSSWAVLGHAEGKGGGTARAVWGLGWASLG
jgi:hypothetical protein